MDGSSIIMDRSMITPWYCYLLQLLAGALVTNGIPHFVQGLSGAAFQSPFATPSGVGESSPQLNVYWGFANLAGAAWCWRSSRRRRPRIIRPSRIRVMARRATSKTHDREPA